MRLIAMYIPRPEELPLTVVVLIVIFFVLLSVAFRAKAQLLRSAVLMLAFATAAIAPDIYSIMQDSPPDFAMARKLSNTQYSDQYFAFTAYMYAGNGSRLMLAGMCAGCMCSIAINKIGCQRTNDEGSPDAKTAAAVDNFTP